MCVYTIAKIEASRYTSIYQQDAVSYIVAIEREMNAARMAIVRFFNQLRGQVVR